jgi:hypothetical protein
MAAELGFNISQVPDRAGRISRKLTAYNMQYSMKLFCMEGNTSVLLNYSIHVENECGPPLIFTG